MTTKQSDRQPIQIASPAKKRRARNDGFPLVWAEVDLNQLRRNLHIIRRQLKNSKAEILAVVKADAYGHGMRPIAKALAAAGVRFFGVANIDEAVGLRKVCPRQKILALGSFHGNQISLYERHRIIPTVSSLEDVKVLRKNLSPRTRRFPVHVKIDTGMGRLGVWHEEAEGLFRALKNDKKISVEGVYTHFAGADKKERRFTLRQMAVFNGILKKVRGLGFRPRHVHAANSLGLLRFKNSHLNLVRPGIILYGINPSGEPLPAGLKPVLSWKTRISFLKKVRKGRTLSYGATYCAPRDAWIATLPVGYSHGYRVGFSNRAHVLIGGKRCPVVGRVTMDQTLVNLGSLDSAKRWDPVTLIGGEGKYPVTVQELARLAGTISYEITCSIHSRIPRIYKMLKSR